MRGDPAADFGGVAAAAVIEPTVLICLKARQSRSWRDATTSTAHGAISIRPD